MTKPNPDAVEAHNAEEKLREYAEKFVDNRPLEALEIASMELGKQEVLDLLETEPGDQVVEAVMDYLREEK